MKKKIIATLAVGLSLVTALPSAADQLLAFPGAEGFGRYTTGGRGGEIYHVTNLNDSGKGSFRDAISKSNRIIVFDVSGVINIKSRLVFQSNLTILGQTAPGEGVQIYGDGVSFSQANNLIVRYLRIRMGVNGSSGKDAAGTADSAHDQIFDHMSVLWGKDENFSISNNNKSIGPANITIQNSIIGQGLQPHSCGGLLQTDNGVTVFRNLYIENKTRNPKVKGLNQFVNNVLYNWGDGAAYNMGGDSAGDSWAEITDNYFIRGPWKSATAPLIGGNANYKFFGSGNYYDSNLDGTLNGTEYTATGGGNQMESIAALEAAGAPKAFPEIKDRLTAEQAVEWVIKNVGASLPARDEVDQYLIDELTSFGTFGTTNGISSEKSLPHKGTGTLYGGYKPLDSDGDGIPDAWETANGLNPNDASDAAAIAANGYANIENYVFTLDAAYPYIKNPTTLKATKNEKTAITLEWNDNSDDEKGFIVEVSTDNKNFTEAGRTAANVTTFKVDNLAENTLHYFRVKAYSDDIESVSSPVLQTMTVDEPFAPNASTVVAPANNGEAKVLDVKLEWKNTTPEYFGATTYSVYLGTDALNLENIASDLTETSLNPGELEENTTYYWRVDATNDVGTTTGEVWSFKTVPGGTLFYTDFHTTPASFANSDWGTVIAGAQADMIKSGKTASESFDNMTIGTAGGRIVVFGNLKASAYGPYTSAHAGASDNAVGFIGKNGGVGKCYIKISEIEGPWKITVYCGNSDSSAQSVKLSTGDDLNNDGKVNADDDLATFKFAASSKKMFKFTHTYEGTAGTGVVLDRASINDKGINFHDILIERVATGTGGIENIIDNGSPATPDVEVNGDAVTVNNLRAEALVQVVDMTGRTVFMQKATSGSLGFVLGSGIYVVRVSDMQPVKIAIR